MHRIAVGLALWLILWLGGHGGLAHADTATVAHDCAPRITRIQAAQADVQDADHPPQHGWQNVTLPDNWARRCSTRLAMRVFSSNCHSLPAYGALGGKFCVWFG